MKITFVIPPAIKGRAAERLFGCTYQVYPQPNLVILYAATILKNKGYDVVVRDMPVEGLSFSDYEEWCENDNSDIYCFHTVPLCAELDLYAVKFLKESVPIIWFGPRPTADPTEFLEKDENYVLRGEVEATISKVADAIEKKNDELLKDIPGLSYRKAGKSYHNKGFGYIKDVNKLPVPDRKLIQYKKYTNPKLPGSPYTTMLTSRQCSSRCYYCLHPDNDIMINNQFNKIGKFNDSFLECKGNFICDQIKDMPPNHKLLSHKSNEKDIKKVMRHYFKGDFVCIKPHYLNTEIKITPNHKIFIDNNGNIEEKEAKDITEKDFLIVPIPKDSKNLKEINVNDFLSQEINGLKPWGIYNLTPKERIELIRKLAKKGLNKSEISKKLEVSRGTVNKYIKGDHKNNYLSIKIIEYDGKIKYSNGKTAIPKKIKLNKEFLRLVGYYLAEGSVNIPKNRPNSGILCFSFSKKEKNLVTEVKELVKQVFNFEAKVIKTETTLRVDIISGILTQLFKNLFGTKAPNKHVPSLFLDLNSNQLKHILYGMFRGDGSVENTYHIEYATSSDILAKQLVFILLKLKMIPKYRKSYHGDNTYLGRIIRRRFLLNRIRVGGVDAEKIGKITGMKIPKLKERFYSRNLFCKRYNNYFAVRVRKRSYLKYCGHVYNFTVDGDHSYTTNFVAVGNCVPNSLSYARELEWKRCSTSPECIKPPVTLVEPKNIKKELEEIKSVGIKAVSVIDDQFVWGKERHMQICQAFKEVGLPFGILARNDRLVDEEIVKALADAGCVYVDFGVESFKQEILDDVGKELKVETIEQSINLLKKYKIEPKINILYGASPLETKETLQETLDKVLNLNVDFAQFAVCSPFPGTRFREKALKEGWVVEKDVGKADPSKKSLIEYPHLSNQYLTDWVKHSYRKFYLRPKVILKRLLSIKRPGDALVYLKGLYQLTR